MSAIDQYCEAIPAPGGDRGNSDADRGGQRLSPQALRALEARGQSGQAIIGLSAPAEAQARAGEGQRSAQSKGSGSGANGSEPASAPSGLDRPSEDPVAALAAGAQASGPIAGGLGTVLLAVTILFFATAWLRYRRRAQG